MRGRDQRPFGIFSKNSTDLVAGPFPKSDNLLSHLAYGPSNNFILGVICDEDKIPSFVNGTKPGTIDWEEKSMPSQP